jgi:cytoskeleton protein RodZ
MDIGSTLRETRMRGRIDIGEVEARTKIRAKYLRALENEEWDLLPGPVYVKSFLRTYGDYLGLDSRLLVDEFRRRYERPSDHEVRPLSTLSRERERMHKPRRGPLLPPWALIAVVLVFVVVALYLIGNIGKKGSSHTTVSGHATTTVHHSPPRHTVTTTTPQTTTTPVRTTASLQLTPTGTVWVCVENQANKPLINGLEYSAGEAVPVEHAKTLLVTLGNANVDVKVNGKSYPLTGSATAIGLKITARGAKTISTGPTCS